MQQNEQSTTDVQETETHPAINDPELLDLYNEGFISAGEAVFWDNQAQADTQTRGAADVQ